MLRLVLPKGSLERATLELFEAADLTVAEADRAGLDRELLDEHLGDRLPRLPRSVSAGEHVQDRLDRRQVDDGVVAL